MHSYRITCHSAQLTPFEFEHPLHVIGNHDTDAGFTKDDCLKAWKIPHRYYATDIQGIHLLVLETVGMPSSARATSPEKSTQMASSAAMMGALRWVLMGFKRVPSLSSASVAMLLWRCCLGWEESKARANKVKIQQQGGRERSHRWL